MASRAVVVIGVIVLLVVGGNALVLQDRQTLRGAGDATTTNETWQPVEGDVTTLSNSNLQDVVYDAQQNVTVEQNGTIVAPAGNWSWNQGNGTVETLQGTSLNTSETASIEYTYYEPTDEQTVVRRVAAMPIQLADAIMLLLVFSLVVLVGAGLRGL